MSKISMVLELAGKDFQPYTVRSKNTLRKCKKITKILIR